MKFLLLFLAVSLFAASPAIGESYIDRVRAYLVQQGQDPFKEDALVFRYDDESGYSIWRFRFPGISKPEQQDLPSSEVAIQILADYEAVREIARQEAKPLEQKTAENAFFTLTETILTTVTDERAGETPPIKLSFSEINGLIKTIQATDPMAAINFSLELLAVDAELKRFDILWWDKAATHTIQE